MHGLINRSVQCFLRDTYGSALWGHVAADAGVPAEGFEALMTYEDGITDRVIDAASDRLAKPRDALLEDLGTFIAGREAPRRLLRFSGVDYVDFLQSLDELRDRVRLAVPDLEMPELHLVGTLSGQFILVVGECHPGAVAVLVGILRAMADDYGALALIDLGAESNAIQIELLETSFAAGKRFVLAPPEAV